MIVNLIVENQVLVSRRRCYRKIDDNSRKEIPSIYATQVNIDSLNLKKKQRKKYFYSFRSGHNLTTTSFFVFKFIHF